MEVIGKLGVPDKQRKTFVLCGLSHNHDYGVYNNTLAAIERAIAERVFFVDYGNGFETPFRPEPDLFARSMDLITEHFIKNVPFVTPMTAFQFAGSYVGRKHTIYLKAANSVEQNPIRKRDSYISAFIKAEKYNFTLKSNPAPRIIQPRNPRYIVESGRYVKPIEKKIYKLIDDLFGSKTIFKGLNAESRGAVMHEHWLDFKHPVAIGLDAKRFDQHVSRAALEWEHGIYKMFYPRDRYFAQLLRWQLQNRGYANCNSGTVKYQVDGCRMSGDVNTALGNCLIMSSLVYVYAKQRGIRVRLANDGDDCVVFMEQGDIDSFEGGIPEFFGNHGFSMTVETPVTTFEEIEFCQCHPVFDGKQYIMVRDPRVAISKDCVALKPLDNDKVFEMWCAAVGQGGMSLTGGIPVWQDFYAQMVKISNGAKPLDDPTMLTGMQIMGKGMFRHYQPTSPASRLSFYLAFGINPAEQEALEDYYRQFSFDKEGDSPRFVALPLAGSSMTL